jgi:ribose 5-phosphate isomerase B
MKIALGSDEKTHLTDFLADELGRRGHDVSLVGPPAGEETEWADVAEKLARGVAAGDSDQGVLCCWTGTGVSIAANKVQGIRAALCGDAETARGARMWNDANVLCLSLRATSEVVAKEILDAWFEAQPDPSESANVDKVRAMDTERP